MVEKIYKGELNMAATTKRKGLRNKDYVGAIMVIPFVVVFCVFSIYPVFRTLYLSFTAYKGYGDATFIGMKNYLRCVQDKFFWIALWNTIKMWGVNIVLQLGLAFLLTIVFSDIKYKIKGLPIFRTIYYLPNLIAVTTIAFLFSSLLDRSYGSINQMLMSTGISKTPIDWLGNQNITPYVVSVIQTWMWFGNSFIMLMASVQGINTDYFEAAAIDGAGRWTVFGKITLPLIKPILLYVSITSLIGGLQLFDLPYLMCGGTVGNPNGVTQTVIMYLYKFGFETWQVGYAASVAYVLFLIVLVVSIIQFKVGGKED